MNSDRMNSRRKFIKIGGITTLASLSGIGFTFAQCREPHEIDENNLLSISGVSIPSSIDVVDGEEMTISGKGFQVGDSMLFESVVDGKTYSSMVSIVTDREVSFPVPVSIMPSKFSFTLFALAPCAPVREGVMNSRAALSSPVRPPNWMQAPAGAQD